MLIARIYEVFPLLCPICGGQMRIIAFITHSADIRHIPDHIAVDSEPPHIAPARGPPLWEVGGALQGRASCMLGAKLPRRQTSRQRGVAVVPQSAQVRTVL